MQCNERCECYEFASASANKYVNTYVYTYIRIHAYYVFGETYAHVYLDVHLKRSWHLSTH